MHRILCKVVISINCESAHLFLKFYPSVLKGIKKSSIGTFLFFVCLSLLFLGLVYQKLNPNMPISSKDMESYLNNNSIFM